MFIYYFFFINWNNYCFNFMFSIFWFKKSNCFSSILHLNTAFISIYSLNYSGIICSIIISISHSLSSIGLSLIVGLLINKTYSRYLDSLFFINSILRGIMLLLILANLSFPGSINFISELLSLVALYSIDYLLVVVFLIVSFLSTFIWFIHYSTYYWLYFCH